MKENLRKYCIEKKRAGGAPIHSEPYFGVNPDSYLPSSRKAKNLELAEIIDIQAVQSLMDDFYKFAHITMALLDLKGNILIGVGWQDICTKFHRVHPETCKHCVESDTKLSTGVPPGKFKLYKCKNNMWDIVTPITVDGQHIGNIFSGQFFFQDEPLDHELFRIQARKYGFNEEEYMAALEKVPRLSRETVETSMSFFMKLANMLSQLSHSNIKLAQSLEERDTLVDKLEKNREDFDRAQAVGNIGSWRLNVHKNELMLSAENHHIFDISNGTSLTYETFLSTVHPEDREYVDKEWKAGLEGEPYDVEHRIIVSGKIKWVREKAYFEFDKDGVMIGGFGITQDITERKKAEEALKKAHDNLEKLVEERTKQLENSYNSLKKSEKSLAEAQKMAHLGSWDWNLITGIIWWSDEIYRIFGLTPQEPIPAFNEFLNYIHPEDRCHVNNAIKETLNGRPYSIDHRIVLPDGEERILYVQADVIFNEENTPAIIRGTLQDITERKKAEERIHTLANVVESSDDGIITESLDYIITSWSKGAERVYGYTAEEILGKPISILAPPHLKEETKILAERVQQGERIQQYETLRLRKDGRIINVSITLSPVFDIYGKLTAVSVIYRDITERKKAELFLANIENARKKEIHHRIKNNLQVISSLLDLQVEKFRNKEHIRDSEVLEAFRESQDRVISISLIHEELHEGKGTNELNFSPYLEKLVKNLFRAYSLGNVDLSLNLDLEEDIFFDIDIAVPLGLIVNEIISNSLKYAFSGRTDGTIQIKLRNDKNIEGLNDPSGNMKGDCENHATNFILTVSDNGVGIPENINLKNSDTLGFQLITLLVDQLQGKLELKRDSGTEFIIKFATP